MTKPTDFLKKKSLFQWLQIADLFNQKLFWVGVLIKVALLPVLASHYMTDLFVPFIDKLVQNPSGNPWDVVSGHAFPYGLGLFLPLWISKIVFYFFFGVAALGNSALSMVAMKLPLLVADFCLLLILAKVAGPRRGSLLLYYWLNPILIYINFVHGQLDVIPSLFTIAGIYLMMQDRWKLSAVLIAVANFSKLHTIIVVPFLLAYLWNTQFIRQGLRHIFGWLTFYLPIFVLGLMPQLISQQFTAKKIGSDEALKVFSAAIPLADQKVLYFGLILIFACLARLSLATRITKEGLFYGCACLFGTLLVVTPAMPGWYYWFFPFIAVFYATHLLALRTLWVLSTGLYLVYFVSGDQGWSTLSPNFPDNLVSLIQGSLFSLLQLSVFGLLYSIWVFVIRREVPLDRRSRPLILGLAGNSGSGKDRMTAILQDLFGGAQLAVIEGDNYHKWERGHTQWMDYTHLDPKANFLDHMADHTKNLLAGKFVFHPEYDHQTGRFTDSRVTYSRKTVILQGLHSFYQKSLRDQLDIKIFMAPEEELRIAWKVIRDTRERGHHVEKVLQAIETRDHDSKVHIDPQRKFADWVVEYKLLRDQGSNTDQQTKLNYSELKTAPPFQVVHTVWNDTPLSQLAFYLQSSAGVETRIANNQGNIDQVQVSFIGEPKAEAIAQVAYQSFACLRHLLRSQRAPVWRSGQEGLSQLVALALIQRRQFIEVNP